MNKKFEAFDFSFDIKKTECPTCHKWVKPENCGFNNCEWMYTGTKLENGNERSCHCEWKKAGDEFNTFVPGTPTVTWSRLKIHVRSLQTNDVCAICLGDLCQGDSRLACTHQFHDACIQEWSEFKQSCPCCRGRIRYV